MARSGDRSRNFIEMNQKGRLYLFSGYSDFLLIGRTNHFKVKVVVVVVMVVVCQLDLAWVL